MKTRLGTAPILTIMLLLAGCASSVPKQMTSIIATQREADDAYAHGDMPLALQRYQALTQQMPKEASYWFRLGNVQFRMMQPDAAVASYQQSIKLKPGYTEAMYNLGIVRLRMAQATFLQVSQQDIAHDPLAARSAQIVDGIATLMDAPQAAHASGTSPSAAAPASPGRGGVSQ